MRRMQSINCCGQGNLYKLSQVFKCQLLCQEEDGEAFSKHTQVRIFNLCWDELMALQTKQGVLSFCELAPLMQQKSSLSFLSDWLYITNTDVVQHNQSYARGHSSTVPGSPRQVKNSRQKHHPARNWEYKAGVYLSGTLADLQNEGIVPRNTNMPKTQKAIGNPVHQGRMNDASSGENWDFNFEHPSTHKPGKTEWSIIILCASCSKKLGAYESNMGIQIAQQ